MNVSKVLKPFLVVWILFASACTPNDAMTKEFKKNLSEFLQSQNTEIDLQKITVFKWDNVCIFKPAGSDPDVGYLSYLEYIETVDFVIPKIKKTAGYILLFSDKDKTFQHIVLDAPLYLNSTKYYLDFSGSKVTDKCFNDRVKLKVKQDNVLFFE